MYFGRQVRLKGASVALYGGGLAMVHLRVGDVLFLTEAVTHQMDRRQGSCHPNLHHDRSCVITFINNLELEYIWQHE